MRTIYCKVLRTTWISNEDHILHYYYNFTHHFPDCVCLHTVFYIITIYSVYTVYIDKNCLCFFFTASSFHHLWVSGVKRDFLTKKTFLLLFIGRIDFQWFCWWTTVAANCQLLHTLFMSVKVENTQWITDRIMRLVQISVQILNRTDTILVAQHVWGLIRRMKIRILQNPSHKITSIDSL